MTSAAVACARASTWLPTQISQVSLRTCTVQFIGSSAAWARNGTWYCAETLVTAAAIAPSTSPRLSATAPGFSSAAA